MKAILLVTLSAAACFTPKFAIAKTGFQYPQPNQQGDYTSIQSQLTNGQKSPHLVWKVVSRQLNCRTQAGRNSRVVRSLKSGDVLDIVGKPRVYQDREGKVWLYVAKQGNVKDPKLRCFVRANTQYIQPLPYSLI